MLSKIIQLKKTEILDFKLFKIMLKLKKHIVLFLLLTVSIAFAQEREQDTLSTDVINVVKPYTPTISDAFKVKQIPLLDDDQTTKKKPVDYKIFSFPVASTFTPAKGTAATIDKAKKESFYSNYAHLGLGSNLSLLADLYVNHKLGRDQNVGVHLSHLSSQNGVSNALTDTNYSDSKIDINYANRGKDLSYILNGGFQYKTNNWYGLQPELFMQNTADTLNVSQSYSNVYVSGNLDFTESLIKSTDVLFRRFGDSYGSGENRFKANVKADVDVLEHSIVAQVFVDYLGGTFNQNFYTTEAIGYGNTQFGIAPTYVFTQDDLVVNIGFKTVIANNKELGKTKFYIYPNVTASYRLVDKVVSAFAGLQGNLDQNSYFGFSEINPFVSPDLFIAPTDKQFKAFGGFRGQLSSTMSYEVGGSYTTAKAQALFVNNNITAITNPYTFGNSFNVVYDNMTTVAINGQLQVDVSQDFSLGVKGVYYGYDTKVEAEAWNLPDIEAALFLDYKFTEKISAGTSLFYVGQRKDRFQQENVLPIIAEQTYVLGAYLDANIRVNYKINDRFSTYLKAQNLAGQQYEKWQNTPVQGIEILGGATYKFDF